MEYYMKTHLAYIYSLFVLGSAFVTSDYAMAQGEPTQYDYRSKSDDMEVSFPDGFPTKSHTSLMKICWRDGLEADRLYIKPSKVGGEIERVDRNCWMLKGFKFRVSGFHTITLVFKDNGSDKVTVPVGTTARLLNCVESCDASYPSPNAYRLSPNNLDNVYVCGGIHYKFNDQTTVTLNKSTRTNVDKIQNNCIRIGNSYRRYANWVRVQLDSGEKFSNYFFW
jgi:hypothetical protein